MSTIHFKKVRFKNFLSSGNNFLEYNLDQTGITAIVGKNGAGKSMLLDALAFGLYGRSFRGCNKPQLINSINQGDSVVEIEFSIGLKEYKIIRGQKPNVFSIFENTVLINQNPKSKDYQEYLETQILRMNFKSFSQIVVLGSTNFVPFMQLTALDRRDVIENLLDIQIFSQMRTILKEYVSENKGTIGEQQMKLSLVQDKIKLLTTHLNRIREVKQEQTDRKEAELAQVLDQVKTLHREIAESQEEIDTHLSEIDDKPATESLLRNLQDIKIKIEHKANLIRDKGKFYNEVCECPTCLQPIEKEFADKIIQTQSEKLTEITDGMAKLTTELQKSNKRLEEIRKKEIMIRSLQSIISEKQGRIQGLNRHIQSLQKQLTESTTTQMDESTLLTEKATVCSEEDALKATLKELESYKMSLKHADLILKDSGIKSKIIMEYLPVMNSKINQYLTALDFFVDFNLDENFKETVRSRHRDEFMYESFSEGQKFRINIAILLTWRDIARMRNSANTNILILDEVFDSSLDAEGVDEFVKLLQNAIGADTHTIVISHRGDNMLDKFDRVYEVKMHKGFSKF